jgi:hypothetical protein
MLGAAAVRARKYPLEALVKLRDHRVDVAAGELARASRERARAAQARAATERACDRHRDEVEGVRVAQREELARGGARAGDLAVAGAWEARARIEAQALEARAGAARDAERAAAGKEGGARSLLGEREREAQPVHEHRERYDVAQRSAAEARDDEACFESWRQRP